MEKEYIEIRSNINAAVIRIEQLERERAEKEKLEREARWERERIERERLNKEWDDAHPMLKKYSFISYYNHEYYSYAGRSCDIRFYEWSDLHSEPRLFKTDIPFYRFLDECHLLINDDLNSKLKLYPISYVICKPGSSDIIIGSTYDNMRIQYLDALHSTDDD